MEFHSKTNQKMYNHESCKCFSFVFDFKGLADEEDASGRAVEPAEEGDVLGVPLVLLHAPEAGGARRQVVHILLVGGEGVLLRAALDPRLHGAVGEVGATLGEAEVGGEVDGRRGLLEGLVSAGEGAGRGGGVGSSGSRKNASEG